jgi:hypothetical protein
MVKEAASEPISDAVYERLVSTVLKPSGLNLPPAKSRRAAERLVMIFQDVANKTAHGWTVSNRSKPKDAHRPRDITMRQLFGSLSTFWIDYMPGAPGVSFDGEHYGGPFVRFSQAMCGELLKNLSRQRATRGAPFINRLQLVCDNPAKVRMWLRQIGITQLGQNFERFLRGRIFIARGLAGWQFVMDEPRDSCYQIDARDPKGRSRFREQGLNLKAVRKAAMSKAKRLGQKRVKARKSPGPPKK